MLALVEIQFQFQQYNGIEEINGKSGIEFIWGRKIIDNSQNNNLNVFKKYSSIS